VSRPNDKAQQPRDSAQDRADLGEDALLDDGSTTTKASKAEAKAWAAWRAKNRRARYGQLPKPPEKGEVEVLWAKLREELRHLDDGALVMTVIESDAWQSTLGEVCRELDSVADPRRAYSHEDCEKALLYQRLLGKRTYKAAHAEMCSANANGVMTRKTLGFDRPRDHVGPNRRLVYERNKCIDGVPSQATICRHRTTRFPEELRAELYAECFVRIVQEHAAKYPEFQKALLGLGADGSAHKAVHKPEWEREDPKPGQRRGDFKRDANGEKILKNPRWEGGSLTNEDAPESKRGHGMATVTVHTFDAMPVASRTIRIHDPEVEALLDIAREDLPRIRARTDADSIGVITMDGAFRGPRVRRAMRKLGYIENVHNTAKGEDEATTSRVDDYRERPVPIEGYPNWRANFLRELFCMCGNGDTFARPRMLADGSVSVSVEGACATCGPIHITSGDWKVAKNPRRYVMVNPNDNTPEKDIDLLFGNPLTHDDKRSAAYGRNRYSQGEGGQGSATTRFNLFKDRAYYMRVNQARLDVTMTYVIMHALAMRTRQERERLGGGPGGNPKVGGSVNVSSLKSGDEDGDGIPIAA
jgi:hypothetical protein